MSEYKDLLAIRLHDIQLTICGAPDCGRIGTQCYDCSIMAEAAVIAERQGFGDLELDVLKLTSTPPPRGIEDEQTILGAMLFYLVLQPKRASLCLVYRPTPEMGK